MAHLFILLLGVAVALEQPYNVFEIDPNIVGRHHSLATNSPTTLALRDSGELRERVARAYPFFDELWGTISERRRTNHSQACNLRFISWVSASLKNVKAKQVGEYVDQCQSRLDLADAADAGELDRKVAQQAREIIVDVKDALWVAMKDLDAIPSNANWTRRYPLRDWQLYRVGQRCTVDNLFTYRVNGVWYVLASVANNPMDAYMPDWQLATVFEYVREDLTQSLKLPWIRWGTQDVVEEGTTFLNRWGGKLSLASVTAMDFDDNPAVAEAMRLNVIAVDQAEDAVTPSNIAILALPMVMSLIPVAFIADLNGCAMLWYIIFTDVFAALPFLIKGVELVNTARNNGGSVVAYHMGNEELAQMEIWAAECRGQDSFRVLGIVFVCIGVCVIVVGVALEMVAGRVMKKKRGEGDESGPFGMALFDVTMFSALGRGEEERERNMERVVWDLKDRLEREGAGVDGVDDSYESAEESRGEKKGWKEKWAALIAKRRKGGDDDGNADVGWGESEDIRSPDESYDTGVQRALDEIEVDVAT